MVDWNDVVHDYLWLCGVVINVAVFVSLLTLAGYGVTRLVGW